MDERIESLISKIIASDGLALEMPWAFTEEIDKFRVAQFSAFV